MLSLSENIAKSIRGLLFDSHYWLSIVGQNIDSYSINKSTLLAVCIRVLCSGTGWYCVVVRCAWLWCGKRAPLTSANPQANPQANPPYMSLSHSKWCGVALCCKSCDCYCAESSSV